MQLRRLKPDPLNLSVNTGEGKQSFYFEVEIIIYINKKLSFRGKFFLYKFFYLGGTNEKNSKYRRL